MLTAALLTCLLLSPQGVHLLSEAERPPADQLERLTRLERYDFELATLDTSWPKGALVMTLVGATFGPAFTLVGGLLLGVAVALIPALLLPAAVILLAGLGGLSVLTVGIVRGSAASAAAVERREELLRQRTRYEQQPLAALSLAF